MEKLAKLVTLQFSFSNRDVVPCGLKQKPRETIEDSVRRHGDGNGEVLIPPTEKCSLSPILGGLEREGYGLVDAHYQQRVDGKDPYGRRTFHMVRFTFILGASPSFAARNALEEMVSTAFWRVRAYSNPFFQNGKEIQGESALSINLEARVPLFHANGEPVLARPSGKMGKLLDEKPEPLRAAYTLRFQEGTAVLL